MQRNTSDERKEDLRSYRGKRTRRRADKPYLQGKMDLVAAGAGGGGGQGRMLNT